MISELARDFFQNNPTIAGPLVAIGIFVVIFTIATIRAMKADKSYIAHMSHLPLDGDSEVSDG